MLKSFKNLLLWTLKGDDLETLYAALLSQYHQFGSNDAQGVTLAYFTTRSNLVPYAFVQEKMKTMDR